MSISSSCPYRSTNRCHRTTLSPSCQTDGWLRRQSLQSLSRSLFCLPSSQHTPPFLTCSLCLFRHSRGRSTWLFTKTSTDSTESKHRSSIRFTPPMTTSSLELQQVLARHSVPSSLSCDTGLVAPRVVLCISHHSRSLSTTSTGIGTPVCPDSVVA